jgi:hypothetical protein
MVEASNGLHEGITRSLSLGDFFSASPFAASFVEPGSLVRTFGQRGPARKKQKKSKKNKKRRIISDTTMIKNHGHLPLAYSKWISLTGGSSLCTAPYTLALLSLVYV